MARRKQAVAAYLDHAQALRFADGELSVETPPGDHILADALARGGNRQVFEEALAEVFGPGTRFRLREAAAEPADAARPAPRGRGGDRQPGGADHAPDLRRHGARRGTPRGVDEQMNIQKLMRQAREMQERMERELDGIAVESSVGGGMVAVRMNGHKQLVEVRIEREVLDPEDPVMLQDLIVSAVNEAARKVDDEMKTRMAAMGPGLAGLV